MMNNINDVFKEIRNRFFYFSVIGLSDYNRIFRNTQARFLSLCVSKNGVFCGFVLAKIGFLRISELCKIEFSLKTVFDLLSIDGA